MSHILLYDEQNTQTQVVSYRSFEKIHRQVYTKSLQVQDSLFVTLAYF